MLRAFQVIITLAIIAVLCPVPSSKAQKEKRMASNVVLVHGAFADGASWGGVVERLQAASLRVVAVQLPLTSLEADVEVVQRELNRLEGDVVLVGHSYGGVVISEAGLDPKVTGLVYVAALAPDDQEDVVALQTQEQYRSPGLEFIKDFEDGFSRFLNDEKFIANFAPDLPHAQARVLAAAQHPVKAGLFKQKINKAAWKRKDPPNNWYAISTMDRIIDPKLQRFFAARMGARIVEVPASHASPVSQPDVIAELIKAAM